MKAGGEIIGAKQSSLADLCNRFVHKKAISILSANGHPEFQLLPSKSRFRFPAIKTNRYRLSFVPSAISLLNSDFGALGRHGVFGA